MSVSTHRSGKRRGISRVGDEKTGVDRSNQRMSSAGAAWDVTNREGAEEVRTASLGGCRQ